MVLVVSVKNELSVSVGYLDTLLDSGAQLTSDLETSRFRRFRHLLCRWIRHIGGWYDFDVHDASSIAIVS